MKKVKKPQLIGVLSVIVTIIIVFCLCQTYGVFINGKKYSKFEENGRYVGCWEISSINTAVHEELAEKGFSILPLRNKETVLIYDDPALNMFLRRSYDPGELYIDTSYKTPSYANVKEIQAVIIKKAGSQSKTISITQKEDIVVLQNELLRASKKKNWRAKERIDYMPIGTKVLIRYKGFGADFVYGEFTKNRTGDVCLIGGAQTDFPNTLFVEKRLYPLNKECQAILEKVGAAEIID